MSEKERVQILLDEGLNFAEMMLIEHQEFHPFGWAMSSNFDPISVAMDMGVEFPPAQEKIEAYFDTFRREALAGNYIATSIFYDVRVTPPDSESKSDAVAVALDDVNGYSGVVYKPYRWMNGELIFGNIFAFAGQNKIFSKPS